MPERHTMLVPGGNVPNQNRRRELTRELSSSSVSSPLSNRRPTALFRGD
jgi:hypothetical protein